MSHPAEPNLEPEPYMSEPEPRPEPLQPDPYPNQANSQHYPDQPPMRVVNQPEPERTLLEWQSPSRPYKKRSREFYSTVAAIIVLLTIILVFAKEFLLVGVILSLAFLAYVLASVEPEKVTHYITNKGIRTGKKLYRWQELGRFWWETRWKQAFIQVETPFQFPGQIILLQGEISKDQLEKTLSQYLIKEKPEPTWADKAATWLQKKVPLETDDE